MNSAPVIDPVTSVPHKKKTVGQTGGGEGGRERGSEGGVTSLNYELLEREAIPPTDTRSASRRQARDKQDADRF